MNLIETLDGWLKTYRTEPKLAPAAWESLPDELQRRLENFARDEAVKRVDALARDGIVDLDRQDAIGQLVDAMAQVWTLATASVCSLVEDYIDELPPDPGREFEKFVRKLFRRRVTGTLRDLLAGFEPEQEVPVVATIAGKITDDGKTSYDKSTFQALLQQTYNQWTLDETRDAVEELLSLLDPKKKSDIFSLEEMIPLLEQRGAESWVKALELEREVGVSEATRDELLRIFKRYSLIVKRGGDLPEAEHRAAPAVTEAAPTVKEAGAGVVAEGAGEETPAGEEEEEDAGGGGIEEMTAEEAPAGEVTGAETVPWAQPPEGEAVVTEEVKEEPVAEEPAGGEEEPRTKRTMFTEVLSIPGGEQAAGEEPVEAAEETAEIESGVIEEEEPAEAADGEEEEEEEEGAAESGPDETAAEEEVTGEEAQATVEEEPEPSVSEAEEEPVPEEETDRAAGAEEEEETLAGEVPAEEEEPEGEPVSGEEEGEEEEEAEEEPPAEEIEEEEPVAPPVQKEVEVPSAAELRHALGEEESDPFAPLRGGALRDRVVEEMYEGDASLLDVFLAKLAGAPDWNRAKQFIANELLRCQVELHSELGEEFFAVLRKGLTGR